MARYVLLIAAMLSLAVTAVSGLFILPWLKKLHLRQNINDIGPTWHSKKQGTPMMGGLMFILGILVGVSAAYATLTVSEPELLKGTHLLQNRMLLTAVLTTCCFSAIGLMDDCLKVFHRENLGLSVRAKLLMQSIVAAGFLASLHFAGQGTSMKLPLIGTVEMGVWYWPFALLMIVGFVNAVNLTDGLDGLASSVTFVVMLGNTVTSVLLGYDMMGIYSAAAAGGCAGFLFWNWYPAKVFMGDTGSMFLGGAVVTIAFGIGRPELLFLFGIVYFIEALSVMIQVIYFKITHGRRLFKMTPIHHHFEMCGRSEVQIVGGFSLTALAGLLLGALYLILG